MKKILILLNFLSLSLSFAQKSAVSQEVVLNDPIKEGTTDLKLDHFFIWVENPDVAVKKFEELGFKSIPDSLSAIHDGQGTAGRYFYFLNTYFELLYVHDRNELITNDNQYPFLETQKRVNYKYNNSSAFGIGLQMEKYNPTKIPFQVERFHQNYLPDNCDLYFPTSSRQSSNEPLTFIVCPELQSTVKDTEDLLNMPKHIREFYNHNNTTPKISKIVFTIVSDGSFSKAMEEVNKIGNIQIKNGEKQLLEIYIDNSVQGKSYDLRPEFPVLIYL